MVRRGASPRQGVQQRLPLDGSAAAQLGNSVLDPAVLQSWSCVGGQVGTPLSWVPLVRPSSAQQDVRMQCHGVTCPTRRSRFPRVPVPRGQHTHQLDALGKGVVFPVLLRETLEYLSLSIPTPCRDKRGIRGQAAGTQPAFQPLVTPGWKQHRHTPAVSALHGHGQHRTDPGPFHKHSCMAALPLPQGKAAILIE